MNHNKPLKFLLSILYLYPITSILVGTLGLFFDIPFGFITILIGLLTALGLNCVLKHICLPKHFIKMPVFWFTLAIVAYVYSIYSPVIEIRQDPSVYAFRAYALINTGTDSLESDQLDTLLDSGHISEHEIRGYGKLANGIQLRDGKWTPDFYAGSSYLMASLGKFNRMLTFYAATWIGIVCFLVITRIFSEYCSPRSSLLLSASFMLSPLMTWFGRANYSEPLALYCFLACALFMLSICKSSEIKKETMLGLFVVMMAACFTRIDMFFLGLAACIGLGFRSWKYGISLAVILFVTYWICAGAFPIYHNRITTNSSVVDSLHYVILLAAVASALIGAFQSKRIIDLFNSKLIVFLLGVLVCIPIILMFRDNLPIDFQLKMIHGKEMRTYNELNMERLFFFYPPLLIAFGCLGMWLLLRSSETPIEYKFFLVICCGLFGFYLISISNSPQMYWAYRRYLYVLIPIFFIGFSYFLKHYTYRNLDTIVTVTLLIFTINLQINSKQIFRSGIPKSEMQGMDLSVNDILKSHRSLTPGDILFYESKLRYEVSSIASMGSLIPIPISDPGRLDSIIQTGEKVYYISRNKIAAYETLATRSTEENIRYTRLGENYLEIPKALQKRNYQFQFYEFN